MHHHYHSTLCSPPSHNLQILRPLLTPFHPLLQHPQIPRAEHTLKRLWISGQTLGDSITLQRIQNRLILLILRRIDMECRDQPNESSIKLAISKMGASTHAGTCSVGIVQGARAFGVLEVPLDREDLGLFEVHRVEDCCPGILLGVSGG